MINFKQIDKVVDDLIQGRTLSKEEYEALKEQVEKLKKDEAWNRLKNEKCI